VRRAAVGAQQGREHPDRRRLAGAVGPSTPYTPDGQDGAAALRHALGAPDPRHAFLDAAGRATEVTVVAGELVTGQRAPAPPPHSWAARPDTDVGIYHALIPAEGVWSLGPAAHADTMRTIYVFRGGSVRIGGTEVAGGHAAVVRSDVPITLLDTGDGTEVLVLQGRPIAEPIMQYGPFVMNTKAEIQQAYADYAETGFGGWPWPENDPNHGAELRRFARHADGRTEELAATAG
jgi:quercetin 2,3-dioxygenase